MAPALLTNTSKAKLKAGKITLGTIFGRPARFVLMRMLATLGYEFVVIDTEHGLFSLDEVRVMCEMARALGLIPIVRPSSHSRSVIRPILDQGAMGLMCPNVESRQQVEQLHNILVREGPQAPVSHDYIPMSGTDFKTYLEENLQLVIQIESAEGLQEIDSILTGGDVDVVEVGRHDLSKALGVPGEPHHQKVYEAVDAIATSCTRNNVALGAMCDSVDDAEEMVRRGLTWLMYGHDSGLLMRAYGQGVELLKALEEQRASHR